MPDSIFSKLGTPAEEDLLAEVGEEDPAAANADDSEASANAFLESVPHVPYSHVDDQTATVGDLLEYLFTRFPEQHCESWDTSGLLVGNSSDVVRGIAIALDPDVSTIVRAYDAGCNVLLTHHPAYLDPPARFVDRAMGGGEAAARVLEAISRRVSLIAMHTNLDKSPLATHVLLSSLGLVYEGELTKTDDGAPGFGCLAAPIHEEQPMSLGGLARRYIGPDGRRPRVWGDPEKEVRVVAVANGSSSSMMSDIVLSGADCAITGEMSYHKACELVSEGIGLIELGHDVSELPLLECLRKTVESNPAFAFNVKVLDQGIAWWQPEMEGL